MFNSINHIKETEKKENSSTDLPESGQTESPQDSANSLEPVNSLEPQKNQSLFGRLKQRLSKTRSTGQNTLNQAVQFNQTVGLTVIIVSKLDGTAKGAIIFAIAKKLAIPIRFIGGGESIDILRIFDGKEFVAALFNRDKSLIRHYYLL